MKQGGEPRDICDRTFKFAVRVVRLCQRLDERPGVARTLGRQLLRAGTAVGANCEEAQAGQSRADFISKLSIALKEARETAFWLRLLTAVEILPPSELSDIRTESEE